MASESIACESRISHVVVYARGAVVTRRVELPAGLPAESVDLLVGGITPLAEPGSVRTHVDGERTITGVQSPLHWAKPEQPAPVDAAALRPKQREARRHQMRLERLQNRLNYLQGMGINADLRPAESDDKQPVAGINDRLGTAMGTADLVHGLIEKLHNEMRELQETASELAREIAILQHRAPVKRSGTPERQVRVSLATGSEHLRSLEISYNVAAARWWPAYSARLSNGGKNAEFAIEAFVAQSTLEDWKDARVSLCTADMISDLTLPELQSLRLGRRQDPKRTGFREPPEGLDAMFAGHDAAFGDSPAEPEPGNIAYAEPPEDMDEDMAFGGAAESAVMADYMDDEIAEEVSEEAPRRRDKERSKGRGAAKKMSRQDMPAPAAMASRAASFDMLSAGGGAAPPAPKSAPEPEPEAAGADEQWLDYDSLQMAQLHDHRRGRLVYEDSGSYQYTGKHRDAVEHTATPRGASDPLYTRGMFDHQFDADGMVEISATGKAQRVRLLAKPAKSNMAFRCVPLEDERVFREVEIANPLEAPLLPGPVDVFMDGALLITSDIEAVDRGGTIRFGLGEEQRVRVARNIRAREESKGVFGGKIAMDHDVSLEVASSLPGAIELELVDRLPVTDDKDVDVELLSSDPKPERYSQAERHAHVRGGLRWKVPVKAGGAVSVNFSYRIGFDKDFELDGGNRRD